MIQQSTLTFLSNLKQNNYREWFAEHKNDYEQARQNIIELIVELQKEVNSFDPSVGYADPKSCLFRIYRDTRFSKNKEPYKPNMGAILNKDGKTSSLKSGYYMHIEPGSSFVSCGVYMPPPPVLLAVRKAIDEDFDTFTGIINQPEFQKLFGGLSTADEMLQRVPKGFDKDSPAAEYLKLKNFYAFYPIADKQLLQKDIVKIMATAFKAMQPLNEWLNRAIEDVEI